MNNQLSSVWLITASICITCISTAQLNRVVFQTKTLGTDEIVQCYGHCTKKDLTYDRECQGPNVYLSCQPGFKVDIKSAIIGRLSPDLDICNNEESLTCKVDQTSTLRSKCTHQSCTIDTRKQQLFPKKCGKIKFVAMDIKYKCIVDPIQNAIDSSSKQIDLKEKMDKTDFKVKNADPFWLMTGFSAVTDNELMSTKPSSLILVLLLAILFGLIVGVASFCVVQQFDKRNKNSKLAKIRKRFLSHKERYFNKSKGKGAIAGRNIAAQNKQLINMNQFYPSHEPTELEELLCNQISYNNNVYSNLHEQTAARRDPYSKSILKEIPEDEIVDLDQDSPLERRLKRRQYSLFSDDTSLPISQTTSSNSLEMSSDRQQSVSSDAYNPNLKSSESSDNEGKHYPSNNDILGDEDEDDDVFIESYVTSDENTTSPHFSRSYSNRSLRFHRVVSPYNIKHVRAESLPSNQNEMKSRSRGTKQIKTRRNYKKGCTHNECASNRVFVLDSSSKRGNSHVEKQKEKVRRNSSHLGICSDNEIARRRQHYSKSLRHNSSSSCSRHEAPRYVLYCSTCGKSENAHFSHSTDFLSTLQTSHGSLPASFRKRMHSSQAPCFCEEIEHSNDTGTDSVYSSTFSTDQEDNRIFAPVMAQCVQTQHMCNNSCSFQHGYNMRYERRLDRHRSNRPSVETPSSIEGTSSRESVRFFRESVNSENDKIECENEIENDCTSEKNYKRQSHDQNNEEDLDEICYEN